MLGSATRQLSKVRKEVVRFLALFLFSTSYGVAGGVTLSS